LVEVWAEQIVGRGGCSFAAHDVITMEFADCSRRSCVGIRSKATAP
jgi:hypothetical protein